MNLAAKTKKSLAGGFTRQARFNGSAGPRLAAELRQHCVWMTGQATFSSAVTAGLVGAWAAAIWMLRGFIASGT